jgi:hypothetical protein
MLFLYCLLYPLRNHFAPSRCTGLSQPFDVGILCPLNRALEQAQLADIVNCAIKHLREIKILQRLSLMLTLTMFVLSVLH